jgi:DNA-directed RNA polymerase specialized sigma24 family protein
MLMMERSAGVPGPQALEAKVAEARPTFEEFFGTEHARLFGALCFVTGDRDEAEERLRSANQRF